MLVLLFVALWFILRCELFYVLPCVILFLYFSVLLALRLPRLGKRDLILELFVRLFDLCLFGFVGFLFHFTTVGFIHYWSKAAFLLQLLSICLFNCRRSVILCCGGPGVSLTLCCFEVYSRGDLFYVLSYVILCLCFSVLLALRLPRLGKRELILVLFLRLLDLCLFVFVGFLLLLVSGKGCGL